MVYFLIKEFNLKLYGIKTCGSVKKAMKFLKDNGVEYEFIDFKTTPPSHEQIERWSSEVGLEKLLNTKGTKYRTLKLKELNLDDSGKKEWMIKEPLLIKRPVIEDEKGILVAFDEEVYRDRYL
ncbi:MAG: arsenate reductase family protein [Campylobacterales bacterium]